MPRKQKIRFSPPVGLFKQNGEPVTFPSGQSLSAVTGSFALTGNDTSLQVVTAPFIIADLGTFSLAGNNAVLNVALNSFEDVGLFALTAPDVSLAKVTTPFLIADTASFNLAANDATLSASISTTINADVGLFQVVTINSSVNFIVSGAAQVTASIGFLNALLPPGPNQMGVKQYVFEPPSAST